MTKSASKQALAQSIRALAATEIIAKIALLDGWSLQGESAGGTNLAIEKTYRFANYYQTIAFVNAVAFIAHAQDHHPDLSVHYDRCVVRLQTHDMGGVSARDLNCAARFDALQASKASQVLST